MRRVFLAATLAVASLALTGAGQAPPSALPSLNVEERADLNRISTYMNSIHTMKGSFTQVDGNGRMVQGTFQIQKPGRMRFEYAPPSRLLVVADGRTIAVRNDRLRTTDRYPLGGSPLSLVLSNDLDLRNSPLVLGIEHESGAIVLRARSDRVRRTADITLVFADPGIELRQWTIVDAQGLQTTVSLSDVQTGMPLAGSAFVLKDENKFTKNKQD